MQDQATRNGDWFDWDAAIQRGRVVAVIAKRREDLEDSLPVPDLAVFQSPSFQVSARGSFKESFIKFTHPPSPRAMQERGCASIRAIASTLHSSSGPDAIGVRLCAIAWSKGTEL